MTRVLALCLPLAIFALGSSAGLADPPSDPSAAGARLLGFSYSYREAQRYGIEPGQGLATLLRRLNPDVVRLPVYWWDSEPLRDQFQWIDTDRLLDVIAGYNALDHHVGVVLTLGERNLRYPEDYRPQWVAGMSDGEFLSVNDGLVQAPLRGFLVAAAAHFKARPELVAWQLENEPFDAVAAQGEPTGLAPSAFAGEYLALKRADPTHPLMVTSYISVHEEVDVTRNSGGYLATLPLPGLRGPGAGHPLRAGTAGDALGLDLYFVPRDWVVVPERLQQLFTWNYQVCRNWASSMHQRARQFWVTEFQAEPWMGNDSYGPADFVRGWDTFSQLKADGVLFWGAEYWVAHDDWLRAAQHIFKQHHTARTKPMNLPTDQPAGPVLPAAG